MSMRSQVPAKPSTSELLPVFQELLPVRAIAELVRVSEKRFYVRIFTPLILLWCLIYQRLHSDHACDAVVSYLKSGAIIIPCPNVIGKKAVVGNCSKIAYLTPFPSHFHAVLR